MNNLKLFIKDFGFCFRHINNLLLLVWIYLKVNGSIDWPWWLITFTLWSDIVLFPFFIVYQIGKSIAKAEQLP